VERQIQPKSMPQLCQLPRRRALSKHLLDGIARHDMNHEKDERENQPESRQREEKSSDEVARHSQWMI